MIRIYNMRRRKPKTSFDVRVDRWSILGNPSKMRTESERDLVCDQYETYFNNIVGNNREWLIQNGIDDDYRQEFMDESHSYYLSNAWQTKFILLVLSETLPFLHN